MPIPSSSIHQSADRMVALIESEIQAHTAAANKELAELRAVVEDARRREASLEAALANAHAEHGTLRAQLQMADENADRLVGVLASLGVTCRKSGELMGYSEEWRALFDALKADGESTDKDEGEETVHMEEDSSAGEPMQDLARVRLLLEKRQKKYERWKNKCLEMKRDFDQQKGVMSGRIEALQQYLSPSIKPLNPLILE